MTEHHPMVPSNILLNTWESDWFDERENVDVLWMQAYQAGADAELEACCEWLKDVDEVADELRLARRGAPISLKERAFKALKAVAAMTETPEDIKIIRQALEQLDD